MSFNGEYLFVYSATNKKLGEHIKKILEKPRFSVENGNKRTRIIWVIDDYDKNKGNDDQFREVWPDALKKEKGTFPRECFVNNSGGPTPAKFKIDIFDPENLGHLEKIGEKLTSAILFSDGSGTDNKLTLLIRQLKKRFPNISIASEYTQPENEYCLVESGADEVFNREVLLNYIMALNILDSTNGNETEAKITDFISILMQKKDKSIKEMRAIRQSFSRLRPVHKKKEEPIKDGPILGGGSAFGKILNRLGLGHRTKNVSIKEEPGIDESIKDGSILGLRSAYLRSIRLNLEENNKFSLDESKLRDAAKDCNIRLLAVFCKEAGSKFQLKPLHPDIDIHLKSGDSLLLLTYSNDDLIEFEEKIKNKVNTDEQKEEKNDGRAER